MSKKADAEKQQQEHAVASMDKIEAAARKQFEADQAAAQAQAGKWVWHEGSGYYYNATHRCVCGLYVCWLWMFVSLWCICTGSAGAGGSRCCGRG
jgi:hypothetical protein